MIKIAILSVLLLTTIYGEAYMPATNLAGSMGCVVTAKKLFSNGNYIRDLTDSEIKDMSKYKDDMIDYKNKYDKIFENAEKVEAGEMKPAPTLVKPQLPGFCLGKDTISYVLGGCSVQNYKVFINSQYVRDLDAEEKSKLDQFESAMRTKDNGEKKASQITLDFCSEF
uniref:Pepsin-I3 domain-containing protein n=1 Tax=Rhabditophanes sp. KR3021 TaxID=114890 RepID=A0AC35UI15_9BILA